MKQLIHTLALLIALPIAQAQTITDFVPKNGKEGTEITITASGGGFVAAAYWVQFGAGTWVSATITDATEITADVPSDASAGDIKVSTDASGSPEVAETSSLPDFRYVSIGSFSPGTASDPAEPNEVITFTGTGFATVGFTFDIDGDPGDPLDAAKLLFRVKFPDCSSSDPTAAFEVSATGTVAKVRMPRCADEDGTMTVTVHKNNGESLSDYPPVTFDLLFEIDTPTPVFTSFTPNEAAVGQEISIMGTGFSAGSNNQVSFGGSGFNADATLTGESGGVQTLTVRVHKNAVNGKIQVQAFGSTTTSQNDFTRIDHTVTTFTPTAFKPENEVTITGTNFSTVVADNEVCFGGRCVAAASVNTNGTELKVSAPQVTSQQTSTLKVKIGPVSINAPGTFTLDPIIPIVMTNFEPKVVRMGDEITITGSGFTQEADATLSGSDNVYLPQHSAEIYDMNESGTEMKMRISYSVRDIEATLIAVVTRKCIGMCDTPNRIYSFSGLPGLTVTATPPLSITNFTPTSARVGEEITITGTGFSLYAAHNFIEFAGVRPANAPSAHYVNNDGTELKVRVHPDARTGDISVFYLGSAFFTFDRELTVNQPTPVVNDDFMPTSGGPGREVTINGENFALFAEYNEVSFAYSSNASFTSQFVTAHWVNEDGTQLRAIIGDDPYPTTPPGTPALPDLPIGVRIGDDGTVSTSTATFNIDLSDVVSPPPPPATPSPIVSSFMPEMGAVGTNVTITGQNFSDTPEENTITFGGGVEAGVPSSASTTSLTVNVPSGATTGPITVTVSGQTGTSQSTFTVSGSQPPTPPGTPSPIVSSFMPSMGAVGEAVVITGQNFSDTPEENTVTFGGGVDATPSASTTTSLTVQVPQNAVTGPITVTVSGQTGTSQSTFTVPGTQPPPPPGTPAPIVSSFLPNMGAVGTPVTITGQNFSDVPAENTITFGGGVEAGVPSSATTTSLTVNVPQNAVTGPITVTVSGQTGTSQSNFTVEAGVFNVPTSEGYIRMYPNPTSGELQFTGLSFTATYIYKIYSLLGQEIEKGVLQANSSIDLSSLLGGQYVLVLQTEGEELLRTRLLMLKK